MYILCSGVEQATEIKNHLLAFDTKIIYGCYFYILLSLLSSQFTIDFVGFN